MGHYVIRCMSGFSARRRLTIFTFGAGSTRVVFLAVFTILLLVTLLAFHQFILATFEIEEDKFWYEIFFSGYRS